MSDSAHSSPTCAACGGDRLEVAMRVAGDAGPSGLIPTTDRFGTALSDIVRCSRCGHMQLESPPSQATLLAQYEASASTDYLLEEDGQRASARRLLTRIEAHAAPGRLLDVGCWLGFALDEARRRGWETLGLEPSSFAAGYARGRLGLDIRSEDLFSVDLAPASFDAALLADVIEHLPDPGAALERLATIIRPGGVLALVLPDAGSRMARLLGRRWWSVIPTHVQYFSRRSLLTLLSRHGWQVLEVHTAPKAFTVRYYLGRLAGYSPRLSAVLIAVAQAARLADRLWAPDFRDRMAVLAVRR